MSTEDVEDMKKKMDNMTTSTRESHARLEEMIKMSPSESAGGKFIRARDILDPKLMVIESFSGDKAKFDVWRRGGVLVEILQ